jgi:regulator of protease activity HflC (stomatin/prohibitin superfamily)
MLGSFTKKRKWRNTTGTCIAEIGNGGIVVLTLGPLVTFVLIAVVLLLSGVKVLREYERAVIFRLGRLVPYRGPGLSYVVPLVERMVRVSLRTITLYERYTKIRSREGARPV